METYMLWSLLLLGIILLVFSLRKPPITQWLLTFLLNAYISVFIGVVVVEHKMLEYPIKFLPDFFDSSLLFEYLLFPVVCVYFYQTTYRSPFLAIIGQAFLYCGTLTAVEVLLEKHTDLIEYHTWTWGYTFGSTLLVMLLIRGVMGWIRKIGAEPSV